MFRSGPGCGGFPPVVIIIKSVTNTLPRNSEHKAKLSENLYLSKEVGDDDVRLGMSPAADLTVDMKKQN